MAVSSTSKGVCYASKCYFLLLVNYTSQFGFGKSKLLTIAFHPLYTDGSFPTLCVEQAGTSPVTLVDKQGCHSATHFLSTLNGCILHGSQRSLASCFHIFPIIKMFFVHGGLLRTACLLNIHAYAHGLLLLSNLVQEAFPPKWSVVNAETYN